MASKQDVLRAELRMTDLGEKLRDAKKKGSVDRDLKLDLREARREYRELREEYFQSSGESLVPLPTIEPTPVTKKKRWWN